MHTPITLTQDNIRDLIGAAHQVAAQELIQRMMDHGKHGIGFSEPVCEWWIQRRAQAILALHYPQVFTVTSTTKH